MGSRILVRCRGRGCNVRDRVIVVRRAHRRMSVLGPLRKARLQPRATVEVRVTKRGFEGVARRYTVRGAAKRPRSVELCVPGSGGAPRPSC